MTHEEDRALAQRLVDRAIRVLNDIPEGYTLPRALVFASESITRVPETEPFAVYVDAVLLQLLRVSGFADNQIESVVKLLDEMPPRNVAIVVALRPDSLFHLSARPGGLTTRLIGIS